MLHVRMDSAENADALGLYVYNIVVVSASCHYCCWLSFSEHVGFYKGRQLLPHFTHSVTADLSYWQLVCWQVRVMLRNCPWWHSSLCQWNKMYEMHHYSFSSRFRKCHVFSVYFMSKVWCQIVVLFFFARSVLCELASFGKTVPELLRYLLTWTGSSAQFLPSDSPLMFLCQNAQTMI